MRFRSLAVAVTVATAGALAACGDSTDPRPVVGSVLVDPSTGQLTTNTTLQLKATVLSASGLALPNMPVTWSSATPAVATVSPSGLVIAIGAGSAVITASAGGKEGQATISVNVPAKVVFVDWASATRLDVHLLDPITGGVTRLGLDATLPGGIFGTRWTPDRARILFYAIAPDPSKPGGIGSWDLYTVRPDGTGLTNLTATADLDEEEPALSPDGSTLLFTRQYGLVSQLGLWKASVSGASRTLLHAGEDVHRPDWSPDGTRIALEIDGRVGVLDAGATLQRWLTPAEVTAHQPRWSPDGQRVALLVMDERGTTPTWTIVTMKADGSDWKDLVTDQARAVSQPAWSPDGGEILYTRNIGVHTEQMELWRVPAAGGAPAKVLQRSRIVAPSWR